MGAGRRGDPGAGLAKLSGARFRTEGVEHDFEVGLEQLRRPFVPEDLGDDAGEFAADMGSLRNFCHQLTPFRGRCSGDRGLGNVIKHEG